MKKSEQREVSYPVPAASRRPSRKTNLVIMLAVYLACLSAYLLFAAQEEDEKPTLGIKAFEGPSKYSTSNFESGLADLLTTELLKAGRYRIVERRILDLMIQEVDLGVSEYSEKKATLPKGQLKSPEYLVVAHITNFGEQVKYRFFNQNVEAYVRVDFRVLRADSGEVIYSGYGDATDHTRSSYFGTGTVDVKDPLIDFWNRSFLESGLGRATVRAVHEVAVKMDHEGLLIIKAKEREAEKITQEAQKSASGKILAVASDGSIVVNLGSNHGLKVGDKLNVFNEETVKDSKDNVVYAKEIPIGVLAISELQANRSKAHRESGTGFSEGHIVRRP